MQEVRGFESHHLHPFLIVYFPDVPDFPRGGRAVVCTSPPSATIVWPVTYDDRRDARNTATPPASETSPRRPSGVAASVAATHAASSGSSDAAASRVVSVQWARGAMQFTRIPAGASSN